MRTLNEAWKAIRRSRTVGRLCLGGLVIIAAWQVAPISSALGRSDQAVRPEPSPLRAELEDTSCLDTFSAALTRVARTAKASVVSIQTRNSRSRSAGSGVIFDAQGHIVTSNHVIEGASQIDAVLADGRKFRATLVGTDPKTDMAVLRINATNFTPARFADSSQVEVGNLVLAIGSPFMLAQTVSHGIVSATGRSDVDVTGMMYQNFIQTDAPTNPGNSGGALVNTRGEVIGINTAIASESGQSAGVAFATPANTVVWAARGIISGRPLVRGYLGVVITALESEVAQRCGLDTAEGVLIQRVTPGGPADQAGLRAQDIVLQIDGVRIIDRGQFQTLVAELPPGGRTTMLIWRDQQQHKLEIIPGEQPKDL